ncbi:Uncharacterised protein [Anaerobiospirillum thomasii]|uniref:major capsid protein n=1 Tax=Anaerobiospirillum thomasii TaxID=179995 RepID=UPI000D9CD001|nr:hypothetical protein [Anaerobiospirillum thomasii]SPT71507.1 Uncharacterised protein [Anaerobiospirillum thomasii]
MAIMAPNAFARADEMLTLAEVYKRLDGNGGTDKIVECLAQQNAILEDIPWKMANMNDGNLTTLRTSLPTTYMRRINEGIKASKSSTAQVKESLAMMAVLSKVDAKLVELAGQGGGAEGKASAVWGEGKAFVEAMGQSATRVLFYGDPSNDPAEIRGLQTRYNTLDKKNPISEQIIDCGGTGNNLASIYIVDWGDDVFGIFPKGSTFGLKIDNLGQGLTQDENGNEFLAYRTLYQWDLGLAVANYRKVVRLCNINVEDLRTNKGIGKANVRDDADSTNLILKLQEGLDRLPNGVSGSTAIYMNGQVYSALNVLAQRSNQNIISIVNGENSFGTHTQWKTFSGAKLRRVDQLTTTESQLKA